MLLEELSFPGIPIVREEELSASSEYSLTDCSVNEDDENEDEIIFPIKETAEGSQPEINIPIPTNRKKKPLKRAAIDGLKRRLSQLGINAGWSGVSSKKFHEVSEQLAEERMKAKKVRK